MKKLISAILSIFVVAVAGAQNYPIPQNLGNTPTTLVQTNSIRAGQGIILGSFTDTAAANALPYLKNYTGAAIWCTADSSIYVRQKSSTAAFWFKIGGAGGGASGSYWSFIGNFFPAIPANFGLGTNDETNLPIKTNNITRLTIPYYGLSYMSASTDSILVRDASGNVGLIPKSGGSTPTLQQVLTAGSTLTTGNSVDVNGNDFEFINANEISIFSKNDGVQLESTALGLSSSMTIENDSTTLRPNAGILNIDSLRTWSAVADTTYKKPMTWDTRNGRWEYASNWFGGGGGGSYTASNGLTLSGSNFKLGGTLSEATSIAAAGYNFDISNSSQIEFTAQDGGNVSIGATNKSSLTVGDDIVLAPNLGKLFIDTLDTFSDTTNFKPLVYRASTGKVERATYWPVGASGGTPAGNFGNLQINRNGAFATPGSDSLDWESSTGFGIKGHLTSTGEGRFGGIADQGAFDLQVASNIKLGTDANTSIFGGAGGLYLGGNGGMFFSTGGSVRGNFSSGGLYLGGSTSATMQLQLSGRAGFNQGADVASVAGAITLGGDGNVFEITGTSAITAINNTNWQNGVTITLLFTSTASLTHGTANSGTSIGFELSGAANFNGTAGDVVVLCLSEIGGTQRWRMVSASVN